MRRYKRAKPDLRAWAFALLVPIVALFVLFSLLTYPAMVGNWPFGIRQSEVMCYQAVFDRRPGQSVDVEVETVMLAGNGAQRKWSTNGYDGPVSVSGPTADDAGYDVEFPEDSLFRGQRSIHIRKAELRDLPARYTAMVAEALGIAVPAVGFFRLEQDGSDAGIWLKEERVSSFYVAKALPGDAFLLGEGDAQRSLAPMGVVDTAQLRGLAMRSPQEDDRTWAAYGLLLAAGMRNDGPVGDAALVYDVDGGGILPIYRDRAMARTAEEPPPLEVFARQRLRSGGTRDAMLALLEDLRKDSVQWADRFAAVDAQWEPALADGKNVGLTQAATAQQRTEYLRRLFAPDLDGFFGERIDGPVGVGSVAAAVPAWMERYRTQPDTIRLVRGKYDIEEDIVLPAGTALVLERGTRLFFSPGRWLVVNGALHMRGTDVNPVFIRPAGEQVRYGGIVVRGTGDTPCRLRGVRMSGGVGGWFDGARHDGMLTLNACDASLTDCTMEVDTKAALVQVRGGRVTLLRQRTTLSDDATVVNAGGAAVVVKASHASGTGTGRGLVQQGGSLLVQDSHFERLAQGVVVGKAAEALVLGSTFKACGRAVQAQDRGLVHVDRCTFDGTGTALTTLRASGMTGSGQLLISRNLGLGTPGDRQLQPPTSLREVAEPEPTVLKAFGL